MTGMMKKYLPSDLLELAWPYYCERSSKMLKKTHERYRINGKSQLGVENGRRNGRKAHEKKDELGRSIQGVKYAKRLNKEKNEEGKSVNAVKGAKRLNEIIHAEKDENGKSLHAMKSLRKVHEEKDEMGRSAHAMRSIKKIHELLVGERKSKANRKRAKTLGKEKLSEIARKTNLGRMKKVVVSRDGKEREFESISSASRELNIPKTTLRRIIKGTKVCDGVKARFA
jgi:hypothetical protein